MVANTLYSNLIFLISKIEGIIKRDQERGGKRREREEGGGGMEERRGEESLSEQQ